MAINIKNEHVSSLALELAETTGESITDAVGHALEARLQQVRGRGARQGIGAKLMALSAKCAKHAPREWYSFDHGAELYDERGLPR
jgi:hypothetical protein